MRMCWEVDEDEMCGGLVLVSALALALVFGGCVELGFGRGFWEEGGFLVWVLGFIWSELSAFMVVVHGWGPCSQGFGMFGVFMLRVNGDRSRTYMMHRKVV